MDLKFEWDKNKATFNFRKHGVQFEEAETIFSDPNLATEFDPHHSTEEERYISIGFSSRGRLLIAVHTMRGSRIRIISSRPCTSKEAQFYDES
jgi:uncharacterized DUF497 family protein